MRLDVRDWISTLLPSLNAGLIRLLRSPQIARLNVLKLHLRWQKFLITAITVVAMVINLSGINLWLPSPASAQFPLYPCDGQFYQIREIVPGNSQVFRVNRPAFTSTQIGTVTPNVGLNGFAYRKQDGLMYAIGLGSNTLYRIDQNGIVSSGTVTGLPVGNYNAATIDAAGNYFVKLAGLNNTIYQINVVTLVATTTTLSAAIDVGDITISPTDGFLYGIRDVSLFRINITTGTILATLPTGLTGVTIGTTFFDAAGILYAYANSNPFYVIDTATGTADLIANGEATTNSDGSSCAFTSPEFVIGVTKAVGTVTQVSPLAFDVPYTTLLTNTGTQAAPNVQLTDNLNRTFTTGAPTITIPVAPAITAGTCTANAGYNGLELGDTRLLTGTDTLGVGDSCTVTFTARITYPNQPVIPVNVNQNNTVFASSTSAGPNLGYTFRDAANNPTAPLPPPALLAVANATVPVAFQVPNITLTKTANRVVDTDGSGSNTPGDVIEYTITASNAAGAGPATGVTITDPIPANTTFVAGSLVAEGTARTDAAADDQANFNGTNAIFRLGTGANATNGGTLAAGAAATAVFRVTLGAGSPPQVSNTATLSGTNFVNQTQTTNTPVVAAVAPNLTLTKTANRVVDTDGSGTTTPGDVIEYTITASNAAGAGTATGVILTDPIPASTTYVAGSLVAEGTARTDAAADDQANFNGTDAIFRLGTGANATNGGSLAGGVSATAVFRVTLQVGSPPQVSNTATLSGTNFANQTQTTNTPVAVPAPPPNITIAKTANRVVDADGSGTTTVGDTLEYSITVTNAAGAGVATGVVMNDPIPAGTTYVAGSLQIDGVARTDATADDQANSDGTTAVFRLGTGASATNGGTLAGGVSSTSVFRVVLGVGASPNVTNTATVNGTNFTPQNAPLTTPVAASTATPNVLLVKRLTRINTTDITGFVDAPGVEDNNPNWPTPAATYLRGAITNTAQPGDELEYTIYFLSAGTGAATNVRICDVLDPNTDFVPIAFNGLPGDGGLPADQGIALALNATTLPTAPTNGLTNVSDVPDRGQFLPPGTAIPANCNTAAANTSGVVVVDVVRSPTTLPRATASGTPTNSYGFIRLRTRVK